MPNHGFATPPVLPPWGCPPRLCAVSSPRTCRPHLSLPPFAGGAQPPSFPQRRRHGAHPVVMEGGIDPYPLRGGEFARFGLTTRPPSPFLGALHTLDPALCAAGRPRSKQTEQVIGRTQSRARCPGQPHL